MFHLHVGRVGQGLASGAMARVDYIRRAGKYHERGDIVRIVEDMGMPRWASNDVKQYWKVLDEAHKAVNARLCFTIEAAIPRVLTVHQQTELVRRFARCIVRLSAGLPRRGVLPAIWAIHEGVRKDDIVTGRLPNPHFHIMISTSINDGTDRPSERWFRRAGPSNGAPRSSFIGQIRWLYFVRRAWSRIGNAALRAAGHLPVLDHRSHAARGLKLMPTTHLGPREAARARAGKPSPRARRNDLIREFNQQLVLAQERRRETTRRAEIASQEAIAEEAMRRQEYKRAHRALQHALESHAMAGSGGEILAEATLLLMTRDLDHPARYVTEASMRYLLPSMMPVLGDGWLITRVRDRLWLLRPGRDEVVVIGGGAVSTDSEEPALAGTIAQICAAIQFGPMLGFTRDGADGALAMGVTSALNAVGLACEWRERKSARPALGHRL